MMIRFIAILKIILSIYIKTKDIQYAYDLEQSYIIGYRFLYFPDQKRLGSQSNFMTLLWSR